jgi:hypothetical protein
MSTVPEVIAAHQMGVRALAVAIITNRAAGLSRNPLSHEEVLQTGQAASRDLARLIDAVMPALAQSSERGVEKLRSREVEESRSRRVHINVARGQRC